VQATLRRECAFVLVTQDALARLLAQVAAAEAQSEPAPAVAADDEKDQTRLLLDELERAGSGLAALRARVEGLLDRCQQAEQELGGCREQLAALSEERERERATAGRRERELAQQRQLLGNVKAKLAEASRALEPDEQV
jgi:chromosome segregation ATPase